MNDTLPDEIEKGITSYGIAVGRSARSDKPEPELTEMERAARASDHVTGKVRKLLCKACNTAIGLMHEDPELLTKAAHYLNSYKEDILNEEAVCGPELQHGV